MIISDHIIIGELISHSSKKILRSIRKNKIPKEMNWYAVTTTEKQEELLYILPAYEYRQQYYHKQNKPLHLLAIAGSRQEAYEIVRKIIEKAVENDRILEMKEYLDKI